MRPLRSFVLAFLLVAVASSAGCGGQDGDAEQITDLTQRVAADVRDRDWKAVCDALSAKAEAGVMAGAEFVGADDCAEAIGHLYALDDSPEELSGDVKVSNVVVTGDRATADVTPTFAGEDPTLRYVREEGDWKVDLTVAVSGS